MSNKAKTNMDNTITEEKENALKKEDNIIQNEIITEENVPLPRNIYKIETFPSIDESFEKAKNFLENNLKGILLRNISSLSIQNPIATGIIPIYNSKNYISRAIKSIQNQNILNIEIILVDDKSTDDTLSFIKEIQKEDQRIKIISNKKNMGILYSRSIGALSAKGKYIFVLDNDDMFLDKDVFQTITKIAEKGIFDIVEFKGIESMKDENDDILKNRIRDTKWEYHPLNLVLYQPALGNYPTWRGRTINTIHLETVYLWAKCIRTKIYQKAINKFGEERFSKYMLRYEDIVMNYAIFNTARSYKFVGKYGVFNIYRNTSASRKKYITETNLYEIYYIDVVIDFVQDTIENKIILVSLILNLFRKNSLKRTLKKYKNVYNLFISSIDKVLKMTNISDRLKNAIRKKGKQLKFIDYPF